MNIFTSSTKFAHGDRLHIAGADVRLRVDGRARRVSLRVDAGKREVIATAPTQRRLGEVVAFAHSRADWIGRQFARLPQALTLEPGLAIEVLGLPHWLEAGVGRARIEPGRIVAPAGARFAPTVLRLLKAEARRVLLERTADHAATLGQPQPVVSIADPKSRWGSCRQPRRRGLHGKIEVGRIRYSWRLVLAPFEVLDYVAAHECAHLIEANHGPKFWALCRSLAGDEKRHRAWLRANAERLHAFGRS
jgi:predicted metal-dependent hydrolase